ncbi:MAG: zinc-finger domain-containing protein [Rhodospirillales bacterium]|nr:zinc-finger domain-containing protein [Rhodospirillales bacterium]
MVLPMLDDSPIFSVDDSTVVESRTVHCDGGGGTLGHPRVYLTIEPEGSVVCPYCSRRFVLAEGAGAAGGH